MKSLSCHPGRLAALPLRPTRPTDRKQLQRCLAAGPRFLEDLEHRSVMYFWEQADHGTGLVLDRASADGGRAKGPSRDIASIAATGFGLTAICIGAEHGWIPRDEATERVRTTLRFFADRADQEHGWFYHWMDVSNGERRWDSETSSVDTAFLLAGVLTAAQYFSKDPEIPEAGASRFSTAWIFNGCWMAIRCCFPTAGGAARAFLKYKWDTYSESSLLYLLAIGSPTHPINPESWYAWQRPLYNPMAISNSSAAARCSRISIRMPGSISAIAGTAASSISS